MSKHIRYELKTSNARPRCKFWSIYSDCDSFRGAFEEILKPCAVENTEAYNSQLFFMMRALWQFWTCIHALTSACTSAWIYAWMHACMHCMSISQQEIRREFTCDNFYKHFKTSPITCSTHIDMLQLCFWIFFRCVSYIFCFLSMTSVWLSSQTAPFRRLDISFFAEFCFL